MENHDLASEGLLVEEAAQLAGTRLKNIYHAIHNGRIKATAVLEPGSARAVWRIDRQSLLEWRNSWGVRRSRGEKRSEETERPGRQLAPATS